MAAALRNMAATLGGRTALQAANNPGRLPARLFRTRVGLFLFFSVELRFLLFTHQGSGSNWELASSFWT
jgi:hypothetical protein